MANSCTSFGMMITGEHPEKRRRAEPPPPATIPQDLLLSEVLPRLPAKHLARFKCVCRSWRAAVESDPAFVRRHLELSRAAPPSILVIPREEFYQDNDDDDEEDGATSEEISFHRLILGEAHAAGTADVELVFEKAWPEGIAHGVLHPTHCDGLVAVSTAADQIFVCNPATREFVALPPGSRDVLGVKAPAAALGYDPLRNRYVIARYFYRKYVPFKDVASGAVSQDYDIGHETFTLGGGGGSGGAGCWEPTVDPPHAIGPAGPVCTREAFYWCTAVRRPNALLRFGLRDRAFDVVPFPPGTDYVHGMDHLTELAGKPCYVRPATETAFDFWVADDDVRPEWTLRCRVDFADYCPSVGSGALSVAAAAGDEMVITADHQNLYSYDGGRWRKGARLLVDMEQELAYERPDGSTYEGELLHHVVPYVESLVSIGKCNY
jgi:F-box interacting protein